jgi:hypothetical protein
MVRHGLILDMPSRPRSHRSARPRWEGYRPGAVAPHSQGSSEAAEALPAVTTLADTTRHVLHAQTAHEVTASQPLNPPSSLTR